MSTETSIIIACISAGAAIASVIFGIISALRNHKRDSEEEGELKADIKYIKEGIKELKERNAVIGVAIDDLTTRVVILEQKLKIKNAEI